MSAQANSATLRDASSPAKLGIILLLIAGIMGLILGTANTLTKDIIAEKKDAANKAAYAAVLPEGADVDTLAPIEVPEAYKDTVLEAFKAATGDYCMRVSSKGYGGAVVIAVGIASDGKVTGVQVVEHSETPGLGANATNESFRSQFVGKSGSVELVKSDAGTGQVVAITGATITSRSVVTSVNEALKFFGELK